MKHIDHSTLGDIRPSQKVHLREDLETGVIYGGITYNYRHWAPGTRFRVKEVNKKAGYLKDHNNNRYTPEMIAFAYKYSGS